MRYDWSKAPEQAVAGVREGRMGAGYGFWVTVTPNGKEVFSGAWPSWQISFQAMDPSAILDDSGDWRESMELRPRDTTS
jgi:hypothetical protein